MCAHYTADFFKTGNMSFWKQNSLLMFQNWISLFLFNYTPSFITKESLYFRL